MCRALKADTEQVALASCCNWRLIFGDAEGSKKLRRWNSGRGTLNGQPSGLSCIFVESASQLMKAYWHVGVVPAGFSEYLRAFTEMPAGASAVDTSGRTPLPFLSRTIPRFPSPASMEEQSADLLASAMLHNGLESKPLPRPKCDTSSPPLFPAPPHHRGLQLCKDLFLTVVVCMSQQCQCAIQDQ